MLKASLLAGALAAAVLGAACAPRHSVTVYDRWAQEAAKKKTSGSGERTKGGASKAHAAKGSSAGGSGASGGSAAGSAAPAATGGTHSATASKARVVKPDDDAVY
jgi:hypothetical protein